MADLCCCVRGTVVIEGSSPVQPLRDARVELGTLKGTRYTVLSETRTDATGQFTFDLELLPLPDRSASVLEVRVYDDQQPFTAHGDTRWRRSVDPGPLVICVEPNAACAVPPETFPQDTPGTNNVWGRVRHADGTPLPTVIVEVRQITMTGDSLLVSVNTDSLGWYKATITTPKDILVAVLEPGTPPRLLGTSRVIYGLNSPKRVDVDICDDKYRRATEWARLNGAVTPLLGATAPQSVDTRQVAFLSGRTGWDVERITLWTIAYRISVAISADVESIYGLLRMGFPREKEAFLARPRATVEPTLVRAAMLNVIATGKSVTPSLTTLLAALAAGLATALNGTRNDTLGQILRTSTLPLTGTQITLFLGVWANHEGTEAEFWALFPQAGFNQAAKDEATRLLTLGELGLWFAPIVASILVTIGSNPASAVATISASGWATIVSSTRLPTLPSGLPGANDTERRAALAAYLAEHAAYAYPAAAARAGLLVSIASPHSHADAKDFLDNNSLFDIATSRVDDPSFTGTADEKQAMTEIQRLYRIAPVTGRAEVIADLATAGFTSAWSVARQTRARFVAEQGATLGADVAEAVARKASALQAITTTFLLQAHPTNSRADYRFLPNVSFDTSDLPDWSTLFGSSDGTSCPHCRSVHGPAAYLVDLLQWLAARAVSAGTGPTLYDELIARRPDLVQIELNCENAERALPYIDLVLEALESAVANTTDPGEIAGDAAHDTVVMTEDMLAAPQYRNDTAYTTLATATASVLLPFHRPLSEARTFLRHLGVSRADLLRAYEGHGGLSATDLATEELGLFAARLDTITHATGTELSYWPVTALNDLASVVKLRKAGAVTWPGIQDFLHSRYVNPRTWNSGTNSWDRVLETTATDWSDIDTFTVQLVATGNPAEADWTRLRQFLRLSKSFGGTVLDLDKILAALDVDDLNADFWLQDLADIHRLVDLTGLTPLELAMTQTQALDTFEDRDSREEPVPSVYDRTFLSPSILVEEDDEYASFTLTPQRNELATTTSTITAHAAVVAAALGVTLEELAALQAELSTDTLNLANLTRLYGWSVVCRATQLRPLDAIGLVDLLGATPFTSLSSLVDLVETAQELAAAGWSVDELRYVTSHERGERVGPTDTFLQLTTGILRDALRSRYDSLGEGVTEASVRDEVVQILATALAVPKDALTGLRGLTWPGLPTLAAGTAFTLAEASPLSFTPAETVVLPALTNVVLRAGTAITRGGVAETLAADEIATLNSQTNGTVTTLTAAEGTSYTRGTTGSSTFVVGTSYFVPEAQLPSATAFLSAAGEPLLLTAAATAGVSDSIAHAPTGALTGTLSPESAPPSPDIFLRFVRTTFRDGGTAGAQPYDDITAASSIYADDFKVLTALYKASRMLVRLNLDEEERSFWYAAANTTLWSLATVDGLSGTAAASFTFTGLLNLIRLFELRKRVPGNSPTFVNLLTAAAAAVVAASYQAFADAVSERTDWSSDDVKTIATQVATGLDSVAGLDTLLDRLEIVRRAGSDAGTLTSWAIAPGSTTSALSAEVVAAARARQGSASAWASVARGIRDVDRKAQRDALVSWLLAHAVAVGNDDIRTAEDLYEYYLIDVSMNTEMLTSRILQASATVQLFVHRLMMGLELDSTGTDPIFEPNAEDREQWEWMRAYRVWEAARKVFLYPENWIEPELRDDKTLFFRGLEQELASGDVDSDRVEHAILEYLDRLREVSNLEILAHVHQKEDVSGADDIDLLHVFARSRAEPPSYWYRRFENGESWTAWEKVDCGLEGNHLVPAIYERRLLLAWGIFGEGSDEDSDSTYQELRLAWSEYRDGKWASKRISDGVRIDGDLASIMVVRDPEADGLAIRVSRRTAVTSVETHVMYHTGYVDAAFSLDACTMEFTGGEADEREQRVGAVDTFWSTPAFSTDNDTADTLSWSTTLAVFRAELDADGVPLDGVSRSEVPLLGTPGTMRLVAPAETHDFVSQSPFFVQTATRSWFVLPDEPKTDPREGTSVPVTNAPTPSNSAVLQQWAAYLPKTRYGSRDAAVEALTTADAAIARVATPSSFNLYSAGYRFFPFYHPHICTFTEAVRRNGVFALLDPDPDGPEANLPTGSLRRQQAIGLFDFEDELAPNPDNVAQPYPIEDIDFSESGAYSIYNWEIFFHVPFYVASRLMDNGRHDDAMNYLHGIFDPRVPASDVPAGFDATARWWKVAPLMDAASTPVTDWIGFTGASGDADAAEAFNRQVEAWRAEPFNPHLLARLRPGTYQKVTVMRYVENLVAWGDQLFTRDTLESLNEATQIYVLARQLLGDRPETPEPREAPASQTYAALLAAGTFDSFGNVVLENAYTSEVGTTGTGSTGTTLAQSVGLTTYFCIPPNARLLSYWDTVDDRLFKIRNGMNIEGVVRTLPLFQPPIDPALLVRAAAAGIDIGSALDDLTVSVPNQRFQALHTRALSLANSVKGLGQALLGALEKKDGEELTRLRQTQELRLLDAVRDVRERQLEEAKSGLEGVRASKAVIKARKQYYDKLLQKGWIGEETTSARLTLEADAMQALSGGSALIASLLRIIPDFYATAAPSVKTGGEQASRIVDVYAQYFGLLASQSRSRAGYLSTMAGYKRRAEEWKQQSKVGEKELAQVEKQIEGAKLRVEIAKRELKNHGLQVENAAQVQEFMERRFTNTELYQWMVGQVGALYFQQFQLALATAKKAEACYNHELGRSDSFIQSVYWDSLRKGLLAGDRLAADLERMDVSYLERDVREYELTRAVSLQLLDPVAVERLKEDGECYFTIPQAFFDLDCPSHYFRRIQSVAVSLACVSGPQAAVNAKLTLHGSKIQRTASATAEEESTSAFPAIVTSMATSDFGLFQADSRDAKYLPFERRGAISTWHLKLIATQLRQFDWATIEDVTLHLKYTAREGGTARTVDLSQLRVGLASPNAAELDTGFVRVLSARREQAEDLAAAQDGALATVTYDITADQISPAGAETLAGVLILPILASGSSAPGFGYLGGTSLGTPGTHGGLTYFLRTTSLPTLPGALSVELGTGTRRTPVLAQQADPPASPTAGDRYLVTATATGAWVGLENSVLQWSGTAWVADTLSASDLVLVEDESLHRRWSGTTWGAANWDYSDLTDVVLVLLYT